MNWFSRSIQERTQAFRRNWRSRGKLSRFAFCSLATAIVLFLLKLLPGIGRHISLSPWVATLVWIVASLPAFFRWMRWKLLWKLRNRLFVTYLLIGVTPVVLFGVLAATAAYVLFGQFANFAATSEINTQLVKLATNNEALALHFQHLLLAEIGSDRSKGVVLPPAVPSEAEEVVDTPELRVAVYLDGKPQPMDLPPGHSLNTVLTPPAWANGNFRGLVLAHEHIYFRAVKQERAATHTVCVVTSMPLDAAFLNRVASGLGRVTLDPGIHLLPNLSFAPEDIRIHKNAGPSRTSKPASTSGDVIVDPAAELGGKGPTQVTGGVLPKPASFVDISINFPTTLSTREWSTGNPTTVLALVTSRPSLLYQRLFRESSVIGGSIRFVLIAVGVFFVCLELLAIFFASRLSRTITRSVSDLYHATREVDHGRLNYRIPVSRQDQLAALSQSFNAMSESLVDLLAEQKEKERLQGELEIAQEVQANLFPPCDVRLGHLELHGICRPARTVSGDYYDFLVLGEDALFMAIGDISGKGISAALLMAGLQSAVRAYQFAGEKVLLAAPASAGNGYGYTQSAEVFRSPGNLMRLLNSHLYRSTQPEKYATLFLAHYETENCILRYSNGGQLPPLILRADGSILRLDQGGTVVGLLDNKEYEEGALALEPGDMLIAYSDGVTEPENEFGDFGETRMLELVHRSRHLPLQEISDRILQALQDWIGAEEQPDDITIVLARQS